MEASSASALGGWDKASRDNIPNLPHDDSAPLVLIIGWVLFGLATVFLGLRLYCKLNRHRSLWWDDYVLLGSWFFTLSSFALFTYQASTGIGRHIWDIDPTTLPLQGQLGNICATFAIIATAATKTSFALTIWRLSNRRLRILIIILTVTMDIFWIFAVISVWIRCLPPQKVWNPSLPGTCSRALNVDISMAASIYAGVMDIVFAIFPWAIIWKMTMRKREKAGLALAMSMGIIGGVAAFIKAVKLVNVASEDFTYDLPAVVLWGQIEPTVTIIAASIPMLRTLIRGSRPFAKRELLPVPVTDNSPSKTDFLSTASDKRGSAGESLPPSSRHEGTRS